MLLQVAPTMVTRKWRNLTPSPRGPQNLWDTIVPARAHVYSMISHHQDGSASTAEGRGFTLADVDMDLGTYTSSMAPGDHPELNVGRRHHQVIA